MTKKFSLFQFIIISLFFSNIMPFAPVFAAAPCELDLKVTPSAVSIGKGKQLSYTYTIKNVGQTVCTDASLSVYYGDNEKFISAVPTPSAKTNYYWYFGKLNPNKTLKVSVTVAHDSASVLPEIKNDVCATSNESGDVCAETITSISATTSPLPLVPSPDPLPEPAPAPVATTAKEFGVWIWDSPLAMGLTKSKQVIDAATLNGFKSIYITVDDVIPTMLMTTGTAKTAALQTYNTALQNFITYANQKGLVVDVEGGNRDWAKAENRKNAHAILDFATQYNSARTTNKIRNVQYDVEPYLLPEYETNKATVLLDFVALTDELINRNVSGAGITMVIPHFYGTGDNWTPNITFGGKTVSTFSHLLSLLDKKANNSLILMSYRNYAAGTGGTLEISNNEMKEASAVTRPTKVIVAQETGNVLPGYVTFYGTSRDSLFDQLALINSTYSSSAAFGGTAVHYLDPFLELR